MRMSREQNEGGKKEEMGIIESEVLSRERRYSRIEKGVLGGNYLH